MNKNVIRAVITLSLLFASVLGTETQSAERFSLISVGNGKDGSSGSYGTITPDGVTALIVEGFLLPLLPCPTPQFPNRKCASSELAIREIASGIQGTAYPIDVPLDALPIHSNTNDASISENACRVAFLSESAMLVPNDTNGQTDVFLKTFPATSDRCTGAEAGATLERISVSPSGAEGNDASGDGGEIPAISRDGRFIAFSSRATNLTSTDTKSFWNVYLRDTQTGTTTLISTPGNGVAASGNSYAPALATDGDHVRMVFWSAAKNLTTDATYGPWDIVLFDNQASPPLKLLTRGHAGFESPKTCESTQYGSRPSISGNLRYVVFSTQCSLDNRDINGLLDIYRLDLDDPSPTPELASLDEDNQPTLGMNPSRGRSGKVDAVPPFLAPLSISRDGRYLAYFGARDTATFGPFDLYLRDFGAGKTERILDLGDDPRDSRQPTVSDDGKLIAFDSARKELDSRYPDQAGLFLYNADANRIPVAVPSSAKSTWAQGETVQLDGSGSSDPDNTSPSLIYKWTIAPAIPLTGANTATPSFVAPSDSTLKYTITLVVNDGLEDSKPVTYDVQIVTAGGNQLPVIDFKAAYKPPDGSHPQSYARMGEFNSVDGSPSFDPDQFPRKHLRYRWSVTQSPGGIKTPLRAARTAKVRFLPKKVGLYTLQLTVNDGADTIFRLIDANVRALAWIQNHPAAGASLTAGETFHIEWGFRDIPDSQFLIGQISTDAGATWTRIFKVHPHHGNPPNEGHLYGSIDWLISDRFVSDQVMLRLCQQRKPNVLTPACSSVDPSEAPLFSIKREEP